MFDRFTIQATVAFSVVASFILVILLWMFHPPTGAPETINVLTTLTGILGGAFTGIVGFFFGSSQGSKDKDDTISKIAAGASGTGNGQPMAVATPAAPAPTVPATGNT